jgi:hypothetical protein
MAALQLVDAATDKVVLFRDVLQHGGVVMFLRHFA